MISTKVFLDTAYAIALSSFRNSKILKTDSASYQTTGNSNLIAPNSPALLGAVALEFLFVAVDPVGKRLIPVDGFAD